MKKAGILVGGDRLRPAWTATTVHVAGGATHLLDGPYAEAKEQLGGFHVIDVPDLDAALAWAARCPSASRGRVEVRPIRSEEHTSELQSLRHLVCRRLLEKKKRDSTPRH